MPIDVTFFKKRILVTGGCGFIGCHLIVDLVSNGKFFIVNIDKGDICDKRLLILLFKDYRITHVIHLAALTHVDRSFAHAEPFKLANVKGTRVLLDVVERFKVVRLLYVSTDEVYGGRDKRELLTETSNLRPTNPYAESKLEAERIVNSSRKNHNTPTLIVRLNNVYGPYQYPEKVIPKFITLLKLNRKCCLHGKGTAERSFLFVTDAISAIRIAFAKGHLGSVYNIGVEHGLSIKSLAITLINMIRNVGDTSQYLYSVTDRQHNDKGYPMCSRKMQTLGWKPRVAWNRGIQVTVQWYMENDIEIIWGDLGDALKPHCN